MNLEGKKVNSHSKDSQDFPKLRLNMGVGALTILHDGDFERGVVAILTFENGEELKRQGYLGRLFTHSPELLRFTKAYRLILQSIIDCSNNSIQIQDAETQAGEIDELLEKIIVRS